MKSNKIITNTFIESLNPCELGIEDFNRDCPNYKDKLSNLLKLNKTSYNDKIWLCVEIVNIKILSQWAVECAEFVLHNYENVYLNDSIIRDCIEATKEFLLGNISKGEVEKVRLTTWSAESAASATESARSAVYSAVYSAARSATWSACSAASAAMSTAWSEQQDLNLSILIALLENE